MRIAGRLPLLSEPTALLIQWVGDQIEGLVPIEKEALKAVPDALRAALTGSDEQPLRCLPPNPRRLKGLANFLLRHPELFPGDDEPEIRRNECRRLLVVAYVYQFHHDVFVRWQYEIGLYKLLLQWVRGEIYPEKMPPFLATLQLPEQFKPDSSAATPTFLRESTYPDPGEANIFWIAPLVAEMGDAHVAADFRSYLSLRVNT